MSALSLALVGLGLLVAVIAALYAKQPGASLVVGGATFSAIAGVAVLLNLGRCYDAGTIGEQCPTINGNLWIALDGASGLLQAGLLAGTLYLDHRLWIRRALLIACVPLAAALFSLAIFSVGVFLILAWWAGLGWLIWTAPPLRAPETSDAT